jgi:uncharacterized membrane protein YgcG
MCLMVTLFATSALAYTAPPAPAQGGYVLDQTGRMSVRDIQDLNRKIGSISKATKNEFACVLLQDMGGDDIETVAGTIFHSWGIGKHGLDNGILVLVALKEHKSRIETGKGVEGEVTDLQSSDILKNHLNPHLKRGDFAGGFSETLDTLSGLLESRANQAATPVPTAPTQNTAPITAPDTKTAGSSKSNGGTILLGVAICTFGVILLAMWLSARSRERERLVAEEEDRLRRLRRAVDQENERKRQESMKVSTPFVPVPEVRRPTPAPSPFTPAPTVHHHTAATTHSAPLISRSKAVGHHPSTAPVSRAALAASALAAAEENARLAREREEEAAERRREREREREREEEDRQARAREREEEDRRRRDDDDSSSSSSGGSFDWGGGSSGGGDDSSGGGGFGGGDSGGGGASSDW